MNRIVVAAGIFAAGIALAVMIAYSKPKAETKPALAPAKPLATYVLAQPTTQHLQVVTRGNVQPGREIDMIAQVTGQVTNTHPLFATGAFVKQGETLLHIEDADYHIAVTRAKAKVAEAQELLASERARATQAKKEWHDLGERDANALFLRKPQLATAQARALAADADLEQARLNLQRTQVVAPFDCRIQDKHVDLGQFLSAGTKLARIYATDKLEVRLPLTTAQRSRIDLSTVGTTEQAPRVSFRVDDRATAVPWQGRLVRTEARIDTDTRVLYAIAEVDPASFGGELSKDSATLTVGTFVEATIAGRIAQNVIRLPRQALQVDQQILVLDDKDQLHFRQVVALQVSNESVVVQGDIAAKERIVVSNMPMAVENMAVSPRAAASLPAISALATPRKQ